MARPDKAATVAALKESFSQADATVLTEYRGLTVAELKNLRRSLGQDATYAVTKNTLAAIAAKEAGITGLDDQLSGPTAIAFINGDIAKASKVIRDFAKGQPLLVVKGGVLEGKVLDAEQAKKLADLESRETLLAKLAGAMKANLSKAAGTFVAPLSKTARLLGALEDKANQDPSIIAGQGSAAVDADQKPNDDAAEDAAANTDNTNNAAADSASNE